MRITPELFLEVQALSGIDADWAPFYPRMPPEIRVGLKSLRGVARREKGFLSTTDTHWRDLLLCALAAPASEEICQARVHSAAQQVLDVYFEEGVLFHGEDNYLKKRVRTFTLEQLTTFTAQHHLRALNGALRNELSMGAGAFISHCADVRYTVYAELRKFPVTRFEHLWFSVQAACDEQLPPKNDALCGKRM